MLLDRLISQLESPGGKWRTQLFAVVLLFSTLFTIGPLIALLAIDPSVSPEINFLFCLLLFEVLVWLVLRWRGPKTAANQFVFGSWLIWAVTLLLSGGISGPLAIPQVFVVVMAALLLGMRPAMLIVALTWLADLVALLAESSGLLPASQFRTGLLAHMLVLLSVTSLVGATILYANQIRERLSRHVSENERKFRALFEKSTDAVFLIGPKQRLIEVNEAGAQMLGYTMEELAGLPIRALFPADEWPEVLERLRTVKADEVLATTRRRFVTKAGDIVILETNLALVTDEHGNPMHYQSIGRDITSTVLEEQRMRSTLAHMTMRASTDVLTGLLNREAVMQHAQAEWERYVREGVPMSIMLVDMDGLKTINDTHGHMVGDAALKALGKVLENNKRPYDWLGRLGGDEFMLVLPGADLNDAQHILSRMRSAANSKTIRTGLDEIQLSSSMGIASTAGPGEPPRAVNELVERADQALYAAKRWVQSAVN